MNGRIEAGFRYRFRVLLTIVGARRREFGVDLLVGRGKDRAEREGTSVAQGLTALYEETLTKVKRRVEVTGCTWAEPPWLAFTQDDPPRFLCDPSLGGLARWLRAAGYEAHVDETVPGHRLPDVAHERGLVLVSAETEVLVRRLVTKGMLRVVWVPSVLSTKDQLRLVVQDLGLRQRESRCMACGGALVATPKDAVRERIPPKTAKWLDEYFVCAGCDGLFWRGTHWQRISRELEQVVAS